MATPKARKLPSGRWNVQITINGKRRSITKDTKKEALAEAQYLIAAAQTGRLSPEEIANMMSVGFILDQYIEKRGPLLSEVSVRDYRAVRKNRFKKYMDKPWSSVIWQHAVDEELAIVGRTTVSNAWNVIKTAARYAGIDVSRVRVRFPKPEDKEHTFLTMKQMQMFQNEIRGEKLELACLLGLMSLRKSEILGVRRKDIDIEHDVLRVRATTVYLGSEGELFREHTKTPGSQRDIPLHINPRIAEIVSQMDCEPDDILVKNGVNTLYNYINSKCEKLGLPKLGVHGLRHTFASICWELDIPIEFTMLYGGWKTEHIVRSVYEHLAKEKLNEYSHQLAKAFDTSESH